MALEALPDLHGQLCSELLLKLLLKLLLHLDFSLTSHLFQHLVARILCLEFVFQLSFICAQLYHLLRLITDSRHLALQLSFELCLQLFSFSVKRFSQFLFVDLLQLLCGTAIYG